MREFAAEGDACLVEFARCANLNLLAKSFLWEDIPRKLGKGLGKKARDKFGALFDQMARDGDVPNPSRFSREPNGLHAFKYVLSNVMMRIPCVQIGNVYILTHGFFKKGAQKGLGEWPDEDVERAHRIIREHLSHYR